MGKGPTPTGYLKTHTTAQGCQYYLELLVRTPVKKTKWGEKKTTNKQLEMAIGLGKQQSQDHDF